MAVNPIWLTMEEAAEFLGVNALSVRRRMMQGELPAHRVDGDIRFALPDLMALTIAGARAAHRVGARSGGSRMPVEASLPARLPGGRLAEPRP
jgi:excisionase family DNA binding protein